MKNLPLIIVCILVLSNPAFAQYDPSKIHPKAIEILGHSCDELVLTCKSGVQKYYYTSKLPIDPNLFKQHLYGNWYDYISRAKSLALKMVIDNAEYTIQGVATSVEAKKLDAAMFALPEGASLMKNPY